ncbi:PilZ domain-containing protein [Frateuria defendens]|uniref:PilZ domain-containing protein n=1 Tax=Frateuria defendens TaxID=2219559 RepID=UPI00066FD03B|nr:PilZ domain-containing protein [Frateuria defendens]
MTSRDHHEQRRTHRKRVDFTAQVTDVIAGRPFGQLGNLSATGMLLISDTPPRSEAIYQLRLPLPGLDDGREFIVVGVQEQWHEQAGTPGQVWAGYRIVSISEGDTARLGAWLALPT